MIKVRVTKESIRKYAENYIWWSDVPDFIELDAEPIEDKCEQYICPACENKYPKSQIIEELPSIAVDEKKWSEAHGIMWRAINELIRAVNLLRK